MLPIQAFRLVELVEPIEQEEIVSREFQSEPISIGATKFRLCLKDTCRKALAKPARAALPDLLE